MLPPKKAIVIDTCIAHDAGGENTFRQPAKSCREFLVSVRKLGFRVVMSEDMLEEWEKHVFVFLDKRSGRKRFAHLWFEEMRKKKLIKKVGDVKDYMLRNRIQDTSDDENHQAMEKDCHLLEAALATDKIVFSSDKRIRNHFRNAAVSVHEIKPIHWANPALPEDDVIAWLSAGALDDEKRQLGYAEHERKKS